MTFEGKPKEVKEALNHHDHDALRAMGKKGAEHAAINRSVEKVLREEEKEKLAHAIAKLYSLSPEGDVLPPIEVLEEDGQQIVH